MGGGKGEGCFSYNYVHPSPLSSPARGEDFILLQFKICVQVSVNKCRKCRIIAENADKSSIE